LLPGVELTVIAGRRSEAIARCHPAIDRVLTFDRHPLRLLPFLARLRDRTFDAWLDPKEHFSRNHATLARIAKARIKVGFNRRPGGPFDRAVVAPVDPTTHFTKMMLAPLDLLGIPWESPPPLSLGLPAESVARADRMLQRRALLEVLVNISAGMPARYWQEGKWGDLLSRVAGIRPARFWLSSSPEDAVLADRIVAVAGTQGAEISRLPPGSLLDVAAVVQRVDVVISMDTSIVHLASVYDRPIVGLYTTPEPNFSRFRPLSRVQEVIQGERIGDIPVHSVAIAYERLLARL
ncbi:MAG: glycosyltransferase family 9 protein, partial [Gemmatimonadales bacterium]